MSCLNVEPQTTVAVAAKKTGRKEEVKEESSSSEEEEEEESSEESDSEEESSSDEEDGKTIQERAKEKALQRIQVWWLFYHYVMFLWRRMLYMFVYNYCMLRYCMFCFDIERCNIMFFRNGKKRTSPTGQLTSSGHQLYVSLDM